MVKVTYAPLLPGALRERQTRREAGAQSLRASLQRGSQAAEQSGRASKKALLRGKEGDGALSYHLRRSIICEVSRVVFPAESGCQI